MTYPEKTRASAPTMEIGYQVSNPYYWWQLLDETTPELVWPQSIYVYDQMRKTDSQVGSIMRAVNLLVLRTPWRIDPNGARPEVVELVSDDLGLPIAGQDPKAPPRTKDRFSWKDHLSEALLMLPLGYSYFEQVYRVDDDGMRAHLRKLALRPAKTIHAVNVAQDGGLISIEQYWSKTESRPTPIPVSRLVAYVHAKEGANWLGTSILRNCYKNWLLKDRLLRVQAQTIERNGMGIPRYTGPEAPSATDQAAGLAMAKAWRSGESSGVALPFGASLDLVGVTGTLPDAEPAIRYHDESIAKTVLAHFLNLGQQMGTGSYALGATLGDFFTLGVQTVAQQIADVSTCHVVEDLVDINFGEGEPAPRIVFDEIGSRQAVTAEALKTLVDAGVIRPDDVLEGRARQYYDLPPADPKSTRTPPGGAAPPVDPNTVPFGAESVAASALGEDVDDQADAIVEALADWVEEQLLGDIAAKAHDVTGELRIKGGKGGGRWTKSPVTQAILDALKTWGKGDGPDDPFHIDGKPIDREPLRKAAVARGITLKRGASREDIVAALKDDARGEVSSARAADKARKSSAKFSITQGGTVDPTLAREVEVENKISAAYASLMGRGKTAHLDGYVTLADLRKEMGDGHDRAEVDAAIDRMIERPDIRVQAELSQSRLTDADRKAAVVIGGTPRELLHIGNASPRPMPTPTGGKRIDVAVFTDQATGKKAILRETDDTGRAGRIVTSQPDLAGLEQWAGDTGHSDIAGWAAKERGAPAKKAAPAGLRGVRGERARLQRVVPAAMDDALVDIENLSPAAKAMARDRIIGGSVQDLMERIRDDSRGGDPAASTSAVELLQRLFIRFGSGSDTPATSDSWASSPERAAHEAAKAELLGVVSKTIQRINSDGAPSAGRESGPFGFSHGGLSARLDTDGTPDAVGRITARGQVRDGSGAVVGGFEYQLDPTAHTAHIDSLALGPEQQGKGFGGKYAAHVESGLRAQGYLRATVDAAYGGGSFWASQGYGWDMSQAAPLGDVPTRIAAALTRDPNGPDAAKLRDWLDRFDPDKPAQWPTPKEIHDSGAVGRGVLNGSNWRGEKSLTPAPKAPVKRVPAKATRTPDEAVEHLRGLDTRGEAEAALREMSVPELKALKQYMGALGPVSGEFGRKEGQHGLVESLMTSWPQMNVYEDLRKAPRVPAKKAAAKVASARAAFDADGIHASLGTATTREEAAAHLDGLTGPQLREVAKVSGTSIVGATTKDAMKSRIVEHSVGFKLNSASIRDGSWNSPNQIFPGAPSTSPAATKVAKATPKAPNPDGLDSMPDHKLTSYAQSWDIPDARSKTPAQLRAALRRKGVGSPEVEAAKRVAEEPKPAALDPSVDIGYGVSAVGVRYSGADKHFGSHPDLSIPSTPERDAEVEAAIRQAYTQVQAGDWAQLVNLRAALGDRYSTVEVDNALQRMNRTPDVSIVTETNQKMLTPQMRISAVVIGNQDKHAIHIGGTGGAGPKGEGALPKSVTKWHSTSTDAQADLYRLSQEPDTAPPISTGNPHNGRVEIRTTAHGRVVSKIHENRGVRNPKETADAEQLSSLVSEAVQVGTPTFVRTGDSEWLTSFIDGTPGVDLVPKSAIIPPEIRDTPDGRRMGLLDLLIKNGDRNPANWYRDADGNLVAYDHGHAFTRGVSARYFARRNEYFSGHFAATMDDAGPNDIPRAEAIATRDRLQALRSEFVRLGREDWWQEMMGTMDQVLKWAS